MSRSASASCFIFDREACRNLQRLSIRGTIAWNERGYSTERRPNRHRHHEVDGFLDESQVASRKHV